MQKRILIAATAALLSLPLVMNAADEGKKKGGGFTAADTDNDGKVTKTEFIAFVKSRMDEKAATARFEELDKNKDGSLSREEFAAMGGGKKKEGEGKKKTN
jgi:Ca2+-binding EF-hand superfamily protein